MTGFDTLKKTGGFTLLELLLAVFIFAIIISAVYGAYITTYTTADTTEAEAEIADKARTALERITADLEGLYLGEEALFNGSMVDIQGNREDAIEFTSAAHLVFTPKELPAGFAIISYKVEVEEKENGVQLLNLYRVDTPYRPGIAEQDPEQDKGYLLCDGLRGVRFTYYDQDGAQADDWQGSEKADKKSKKEILLPSLVEIELSFYDPHAEKGVLVFRTAVALQPQSL